MKYLAIVTVALSLGVGAQTDYSPNSGKAAPGNFTETTKTTMTDNTSSTLIETSDDASVNEAKTDEVNTGMSAAEMNTAPTETPTAANESDSFGKTLSTGETASDGTFAPGSAGVDKQAQEAVESDKSASPKKRTIKTERTEEIIE